MSTTATTRILHASANASAAAVHGSWVWPLPRLDGIAPCIVQQPLARAPTDGVAIGYPGRAFSHGLVPVFAAGDGVITYAGRTECGSTLCLDHVGGWSTQYSELEHLLARPTDRFRRRRKERVRAGDIIGYARRTPPQIRFGLSQFNGDECAVRDPAAWIPEWSLLPWFEGSARAPRLLSDRPRSP
jgi:murein DD-endopeptidase MepM/ murein hydrolase activator NlpD